MKRNEKHAGTRLIERGAAGLSLHEINEAIKTRAVIWLKRLTCSRSLCSINGPEGQAYAVVDRKKGLILTVLTKEQADQTIKNADAKRGACDGAQ
jgi:hypothetical protein